MGKEYEYINDDHKNFINSQHLFFVSTAPLNENGHINLSPKGFDCFRILSATRVGYLDIVGSRGNGYGYTVTKNTGSKSNSQSVFFWRHVIM